MCEKPVLFLYVLYKRIKTGQGGGFFVVVVACSVGS